MQVPLPWEQLLWTGRALWPPYEWYALTDFRVASSARGHVAELALQDIAEVRRTETLLDRFSGTSSIELRDRRGRAAVALRHVRRGPQLAALLELLAGNSQASLDSDAVAAALAWAPRGPFAGLRESFLACAAVATAVFGVVIGLQGDASVVVYPPDDAIYPDGAKRDRESIVRFMEDTVMPWARATLGPLKGGPDMIACETCHGRNPEEVAWQMPGVAALPEPDLQTGGWERYSAGMDAQMRNAIYGYAAESDKQVRARYMREVVMPGMARLLGRPPYDFAKSYVYNRSRFAFGCYHCHKVK